MDHIDEAIEETRTRRAELLRQTRRILDIDSSDAGPDEFAHLQGLFRGFSEKVAKVMDEHIVACETLRAFDEQLTRMRDQYEGITDGLTKIAKGDFDG